MNITQKKKKSSIKVNSQCFFLLIAIFVLFYVHLLADLELPGGDDSELILPPPTRAGVASNGHKPTTYVKPPLEEYIQEWNITKDVNWLLDFSIVGAPKTGTSTLMNFLHDHNESVFIFTDERCELSWNRQVVLLKDLYEHYQPNRIMGVKCPNYMHVTLAMDNFKTYFPKTKFIVGVRSPILWFESFYNFRIQNRIKMLPIQNHVGKCYSKNRGVCTTKADYKTHLAQFEDTRDVFIFETSQLKNTESTDTFLLDLQNFLGLKTPLQGPITHVKPGKASKSQEHQADLDSKKVDICEPKYAGMRDGLRKMASESADWILNEFLTKPNVKVSSPDYFRSKLQEWHTDPCDTERNQ